jgi:hypothetical protein
MAYRYEEQPGIPHIIRLTSDAQWEVTNEFKKSGGKKYCYLFDSQFKYEYFFFFSDKK